MSKSARPRTYDPNEGEPLEEWLRGAIAADGVTINSSTLLSGGAVQENWRLDVSVDGGPRSGNHAWVMRTDAAAVISMSLDRASEFGVLCAAFESGIRVAEPIARCDDAAVIGAAFLIQDFVSGLGQARRIVRDAGLPEWGSALAHELAQELAKIHRISASDTSIPALPIPIGNPAAHEVAKLRKALDSGGEPRPALEYVLHWLVAHAPPAPGDQCLVHGDFRTGNYLVDDGRLAAVLDWEFCHWGDANEDVGWFCARCWRFGNTALEAGGIAPRQAFFEAYEAAAQRRLDPLIIRYWEIMAAAKWATIAMQQGDRFRIGGEISVELALTGLMVSELELEALDGIRAYEAGRGVC
ncbi:MAG: phosphotransferase family protein [Hyphomicrobiaceae bacterium]